MIDAQPSEEHGADHHPNNPLRDVHTSAKRQRIDPPLPRVRVCNSSPEEQQQISSLAREAQERFGLSYAAALIAVDKNFSAGKEFDWEGFDRWLHPSLKRDLPKLGSLKGLASATRILIDAIAEKEKIALVGDYDVDGVTSSTIMYRGLKALGADVSYYSSRRFSQGYGINKEKVRALHKKGVNILVTLDFGTKNIEEIALAKELGMKVVVIDHHHKPAGKGPDADALINPKQNGCGFGGEDLCTGGLAYVTMRRIRERAMRVKGQEHRTLRAKARQFDTNELLPYAAFATVADVVELRGANRAIVKEGLKLAADSKHVGIKELLKVCDRLEPTSSDVGFQIGPRINALGRLLDTGADKGVLLFTTRSKDIATRVAKLSQEQNLKRRHIEREGTRRARALIRQEVNQLGEIPSVNVVFDDKKDAPDDDSLGDDFHQGVVSIMASRESEYWCRPCIIFAEAENGNLVGSARGLGHLEKKDFHLAETLETPAVKNTLKLRDGTVKAGGHEKAAGLSCLPENLHAFKEAVREEASRRLEGVDITRYETGNVEVTIKELNEAGPALFDELGDYIEPCGEANPATRFGIRNAKVKLISNSKNGGLKVTLHQIIDGRAHIIHARWFQRSGHPALKKDNYVDLVASIDKHTRHADHNVSKQRLELRLEAVDLSTLT